MIKAIHFILLSTLLTVGSQCFAGGESRVLEIMERSGNLTTADFAELTVEGNKD